MKWFIKIWFEKYNYEWRENISVEAWIWKISLILIRVGVKAKERARKETKNFSGNKELKN